MQRTPLLLALAACGLASLGAVPAQKPDADGFIPVFNGKDLAGWEGDPRLWAVRDGAITGQTTKENATKGNTFLIWKGGDVSDFELRVRCRIVGGNSGIQYRSTITDPRKWVVHGYQADFGGGETHNGKLYDEGGKRGAIASPGEQVHVGPDGKRQVTGTLGNIDEIKKGINDGEWYDYVITAKGNHLVHKLNGQVMIDVVDQDPKAPARGVLAFQIHAGAPMTVQFKDVMLKKAP